MGEAAVADRASDKPQDHQSSRELLRWLLLVPLAFLILFGCGQLALSDVVYPTVPDTRSKLRADYGAWPVVMIPAIDPAIIEDIRRDEQFEAEKNAASEVCAIEAQRALPVARRFRPAQALEQGAGVEVGKRRGRHLGHVLGLLRRNALAVGAVKVV